MIADERQQPDHALLDRAVAAGVPGLGVLLADVWSVLRPTVENPPRSCSFRHACCVACLCNDLKYVWSQSRGLRCLCTGSGVGTRRRLLGSAGSAQVAVGWWPSHRGSFGRDEARRGAVRLHWGGPGNWASATVEAGSGQCRE